MEFQSGIQRLSQKVVSTVELTDMAKTEMNPLFEVQSEIWMIGSKEAIAQANDLVAHCGTIINVATRNGEARSRLTSRVLGEKWTQAQLDAWQNELYALAEARKKFGEIARKETGLAAVDLYASNEVKMPVPPSSPAHLPKVPLRLNEPLLILMITQCTWYDLAV